MVTKDTETALAITVVITHSINSLPRARGFINLFAKISNIAHIIQGIDILSIVWNNTAVKSFIYFMTEEKKSKAVNVFAILGFALLLLVAIWSTVQVVKFVPRMFGGDAIKLPSISLGDNSKLKVTLSKLDVASGEPLEVNWEFGKKSDEGVMSFSYGCEPGFHFRLPGATTADYTVLPCNAPYNIPSGDNSMIVIPVSDSNRYMDASLAITFTDAKGESVRDVASITITNEGLSSSPDTLTSDTTTQEDTPEVTTTKKAEEEFSGSTKGSVTPAQTTPVTQRVTKQVVRYVQVPVTPYSNPAGLADLEVRILSVGSIDPYTGVIVPKGTLRKGERAAVQFEVKNVGDKTSGNWTYSAELPTNPRYVYAGKMQQALMPGSSATVTVAFDRLVLGHATIAVKVDPYNMVPERNEGNNADARYFSVY